VKNFKKDIIPLIGYFISHESHHPGDILVTVKQAGENLPDAKNGVYGNGESKIKCSPWSFKQEFFSPHGLKSFTMAGSRQKLFLLIKNDL
jgi:hypothetical protein